MNDVGIYFLGVLMGLLYGVLWARLCVDKVLAVFEEEADELRQL